MLRSLARFSLVLFAFWAAATMLQWPVWLAFPIGGFFGLIAAFVAWWQTKTKIYTRNQLAAKPFNGQLPQELANAIATSPALRGDDSYSQKVAGEKAYGDNFLDLMQYAEMSDGSTLEVQSALVAEPANEHSQHAVAVTCGGVVLGYIPEFESESLYAFLMERRGIARVNSNIHFDIAGGLSWAELDLVRPYETVADV